MLAVKDGLSRPGYEASVEGKQNNEVEGKAAGRKAGPKSGPRNALVLAHGQHSAPRHTTIRLPG